MLYTILLACVLPQSQKINAPLPRDSVTNNGQDVFQATVSPDGLWVVYVADQDVDSIPELYSAPVDGSAAARKLSGGETLAVNPLNLVRIDPAGTTVYYRALAGNQTLYRVPIDGSAPRQVLATNPATVTIAPDGQHVVFTDAADDLYSAPVDGSTLPLFLDGDVTAGDFRITSDGSTIVYRGDAGTANKLELWRVPIDGSAFPERISLPLGPDRDVQQFDVTADGTRAIYRANPNVAGVFDLCSVPVDPGSGLSSFCTALPTFADVQGFRLSPDGASVLFLADARFDERYELFVAPVDGSANPRLLSGTMIPEGDVLTQGYDFSPDGAFALFLADRNVDDRVELFSAPLTSVGPPVRLSPDLIPEGDVQQGFVFSGTQVVFRADAEHDGRFALYGVAESGGTAVRLHDALDSGQSVEADVLPASGGRVVFRGDLDRESVLDLWSAPADGSAAPTRLSSTLGLAGGVRDLAFYGGGVTSDSAVFLADIDPDETFQVWRAPLDGTQPPVALNGPLMSSPILGDVSTVGWSPDGGTALYVADQATDGRHELFAVDLEQGIGPYRLNLATGGQTVTSDTTDPALFLAGGERLLLRDTIFPVLFTEGSDSVYTTALDGSETPIRIDAPATGNKGDFQVLGERALFVQSFSGVNAPLDTHVWSAPLDGSAPAIELSLGGGELAHSPVPTPDEAFVWFTSDSQLYRAPVDGSSPPEPLSLGVSGNLRVAPQGDRIVFTADPSGTAQGLYVLPIDGSGVPLRLDEAPPGRTIDGNFVFTPGGERVLYVADQETAGVPELFSVSIDGGPTVKLSPTPVSGGGVTGEPFQPLHLRVSPDGERVVFVGDLDVDEVLELYSAPVDGSVPAVKLNDPLGDARDVVDGSVRFAPAASLVLWQADQEVDGRLELYAAPIDGSRAAVKLNPPLVAGGSVQSGALEIGPRGLRAYYLADQEVDQRVELFAVSLLGLGVQRVNDPLVAGGNVASFRLSPSGHQVLYVADQEVNEVYEAFLVTFPDVTPVAPHPAPTRSVTATTD